MIWLLFAALGQPLAFELYRLAPLVFDASLYDARMGTRFVTLAGPVLVLAALSSLPCERVATSWYRSRFAALWAAFGLMMLAVHQGLERNEVYRLTYLGQQILVVLAWWHALVGERWRRDRRAHIGRVGGWLAALFGVGVCLTVIYFGGLHGTFAPSYDPRVEPSQAALIGMGWLTSMPVGISFAALGVAWMMDCGCRHRVRWLRRSMAAIMLVGKRRSVLHNHETPRAPGDNHART